MFTSETMSMLATSILIPTSTGGPTGEVGHIMGIISEWPQAGEGRGLPCAYYILNGLPLPTALHPLAGDSLGKQVWAHE